MDEQELKNEIEELKRKNSDFELELKELKRVMELHQHIGNDGSSKMYNTDIVLKEGSRFQVGRSSFESAYDKDQDFTVIVTGEDAGASGTQNFSKSAQLVVEHQPLTNGSSNQTFFYGIRNPLYINETNNGSITSGGTTMTQSVFSWETNELDGAYLLVKDSSTGDVQFDVYEIASNTSDTITITGGTWTFTNTSANFTIFVPIYFGASQYPWRRLYTTEGAAGGVRFGMGHTNGGQNGMLYMDSSGDIIWRNKVNSVTMSIASPCVITHSSHGYGGGEKVIFSTTDTLPTGVTIGIVYYIKYIDTNTFNIASTYGGANINTSGSQSGIHNIVTKLN